METGSKPKKRYLAVILVIILAVLGVFFYLHSLSYESTDDAFIEGHIIRISPKVTGNIIKINVQDNQNVKKGDLLLEIDPKDYQLKVNQAVERLEITKNETESEIVSKHSTVIISEKQIEQAKSLEKEASANLVAVESELALARKDFIRYSNLLASGGVSKQQLDKAQTYLTATESKYKSAQEKSVSAKLGLEAAIAKKTLSESQIKEGIVMLDKAELDLSNTKLYAPQDGKVTSKSAQEGALAHAGAPLLSIVPDERWIIANFKETQLKKMRVGQEVEIKLDAYPQLKLKGKVQSLQASTGSKTSLFPPENAVGSYVKIVQRIPVKILITSKIDSQYEIVPGMSVVPKVKVK